MEGGLQAGGDGWLFSAMFAQRIAGAADGRGKRPAAPGGNRYGAAVMRLVKFRCVRVF